jgi:hypothetical protein
MGTLISRSIHLMYTSGQERSVEVDGAPVKIETVEIVEIAASA